MRIDVKDFRKGDRVIVNGIFDTVMFKNSTGTVVGTYERKYLQIEFDERISNRMHTCNGRAKSGNGYNMYGYDHTTASIEHLIDVIDF